MIARFEGGPANGYETYVIGRDDPPDYFLLMPSPSSSATDMPWVVCGVDFDDHWPGQSRYEHHEDLMTEVSPDRWEDLSVYVYVPDGEIA